MEARLKPRCGRRFLKRSSIALVCVLLLVAVAAGPALAGSYAVGGHLNRDGSLVRYPTIRVKSFTGPATMFLYNNTVNFTRLGLRNPDTGVQFTHTFQWNHTGISHQFVQMNGSINIPRGTRFAFNGRMGSTFWPMDNHWEGNFTY